MRTTEEKPIVDAVFSSGTVFVSGEQTIGAISVTERESATPIAKWAAPARGDQFAIKRHRPGREVQPLAAQRMAGESLGGRHMGRWWLAGCLVLAALFGGGMFGGARPEEPATVAARPSASRAIETIRVGDRVVTHDAGALGLARPLIRNLEEARLARRDPLG